MAQIIAHRRAADHACMSRAEFLALAHGHRERQ